MSRVILPPFQHKYGATELSHALDAERLDAAFTEVANALNGGIDETNLSAGVTFSTGTPGGAAVSTAIGAKYSLLTLRATALACPASGQVILGHAWSANWVFVNARLRGFATGIDGVATFSVSSTLSYGAASIAWTPSGTGFEFSSSLDGVGVAVNSGVLVKATLPSTTGYACIEATFKVPVL